MEKNNDKQLIQLPPNDLSTFDYVSTRHDARVQQGVKPSDVLVPGFWAHHAVKLKPFDEIRVRADDGTWMGLYLVLDCSRVWAKVKELAFYQLGTADVALTRASEADVQAIKDQHNVVHRGPHKWSVVRKADKAVLTEGLAIKDEAIAFLDKYAREQVGAPTAPRAEPVAATA